MLHGVGLGNGHRLAFGMESFADSRTAIEAHMPMGIAVALPIVGHICVSAGGIVVALLKTLLVGIAPMVGKGKACHAKLMLTALRLSVGEATSEAQLAIVATIVAFEAVVTLLTNKVVAIFEVKAIGAVVMHAMITIGTILALAAELTKFVHLEAVAAIAADVLIPFGAIGTEAMLAMIVLLAIGTKEAILTVRLVGTNHAARANVLFIIRRHNAKAMRTSLIV